MKVSDLADHIRQVDAITVIIGAGASKSAGIPLANGLIKIIEKKFEHCLRDLSDKDRKSYGKVMAKLSRQERKMLIEPLLRDASLNWGHVALASIVQQSNVKRVLSFNFDFLLEQAAGLLGFHLPVYDFGIAPSSNVSRFAEKAIFHLHGQSYGLRLLNSEDETKKTCGIPTSSY